VQRVDHARIESIEQRHHRHAFGHAGFDVSAAQDRKEQVRGKRAAVARGAARAQLGPKALRIAERPNGAEAPCSRYRTGELCVRDAWRLHYTLFDAESFSQVHLARPPVGTNAVDSIEPERMQRVWPRR